MNIEQLERLRKMISSMRAEVDTDVQGAKGILDAIGTMEEVILQDLKSLVWKRYREAEKVG